ncbi:MAG: ATP-binding protein, partial [Planctomycetes bacterium]|nr:ATP-binding protein [Planctomycetota bacterium]
EAAVTGQLTAEACNALEQDYSFEGQTVGEAEKEILLVLEHDGYLVRKPDGYVFVSSLVRDWWKARHSFGFIPILERGV